jgi:hypothetical protein
MFDHLCYSIGISSKYLMFHCPETPRQLLVNCPGLELFIIQIVKLLIICNGDTVVNGIIAHGMFLAL